MYSSYHEELTRRLAAQVWNDEEARHLPIDFKLVGAIARKFIAYVAAVEPDPTPVPVVENVVVDAAPELVPLELCTGETVLALPTGEVMNLREHVDTLQATNEADLPPIPEAVSEPIAEVAVEVAADNIVASELTELLFGHPESKTVELKELLYGENPVASEAPAAEAQADTPVVEPEAAPLLDMDKLEVKHEEAIDIITNMGLPVDVFGSSEPQATPEPEAAPIQEEAQPE